jgi:Tfp pilus assembly protein PilX
MKKSGRTWASPPTSQQGIVLFVALIVLVVMSLIGVSMIRQGTSNQLIVGNLAFKESGTLGADLGIETARNWLVTQNGSTLNATDTNNGYFANGLVANFDPFSSNSWDQSVNTTDAQGNSVRYVIHRLCPVVGEVVNADPTKPNLCIIYSGDSVTKEGVDYVNTPLESIQPYYRVTVRVTGPRNTTSYVQATLY